VDILGIAVLTGMLVITIDREHCCYGEARKTCDGKRMYIHGADAHVCIYIYMQQEVIQAVGYLN